MSGDRDTVLFQATTRSIRVDVQPVFLRSQSCLDVVKFFWAYEIKIENKGLETIQLKNRRWEIINARGQIEKVEGVGIVGKQPVLGPGGRFRYKSGVSLATPSGLMRGTYEMKNERGERFWIEIPTFSLDSPYEIQALN